MVSSLLTSRKPVNSAASSRITAPSSSGCGAGWIGEEQSTSSVEQSLMVSPAGGTPAEVAYSKRNECATSSPAAGVGGSKWPRQDQAGSGAIPPPPSLPPVPPPLPPCPTVGATQTCFSQVAPENPRSSQSAGASHCTR